MISYLVNEEEADGMADRLYRKARAVFRCSPIIKELKASQNPTYVTVTFDDGYKGVYDNAYPLMKRMGYHGVCFVITSKVGNMFEGKRCMDKNMLQELNDVRWEIASHTKSHVYLDTITRAEAKCELLESKEYIENNINDSRPVVSMSYPGSKYCYLASLFYKFCRIGGVAYTNKTWNMHPSDKIPATSITDKTHKYVRSYIDHAKKEGESIVFYFHNVTDDGTPYDITPKHFSEVLNTIRSRDVEVKTFKETLRFTRREYETCEGKLPETKNPL